jgi:hypothetical protein
MSFLEKIDEEIKEAEENTYNRQKKEEKRRDCLECILF